MTNATMLTMTNGEGEPRFRQIHGAAGHRVCPPTTGWQPGNRAYRKTCPGRSGS